MIVVSYFSFLTLRVFTIIAVLSSLILRSTGVPAGLTLLTRVVAVLVLFTGDRTRWRVSLYDWRPSLFA
jgi:hypothetical protein